MTALLRIVVIVSLFFAVSSCSQCTTTECGDGRSATWCIKGGRECGDCKNHKLTDEKGNKLTGCEDGYYMGTITPCDDFIRRDITDYCASGKVCIGLQGACTANADCCTGVCGSVTRQCITP